MKNWEKFEIDATDYLNKTFSEYASFIHNGKSNSKVSDIKVITKAENIFYIEVKKAKSQSGQFVLKINKNTKKFLYSDKNNNPVNSYATEIINFMNENFDNFDNVSTKGKDIFMTNKQEIFSNWIIEMYKSKSVTHIITENFVIIPLNSFGDYFTVTGKYRIKKSGSSSPAKSKIVELKNYLKNKYQIKSFGDDISKLIFSTDNEKIKNTKFYLNETEYMISVVDDTNEIKKYEIRKLSKTFNANVIFSIELNKDVDGLTNKQFISFLNSTDSKKDE